MSIAARRAAAWTALLVLALAASAWQIGHRTAAHDDVAHAGADAALVGLDYARWAAVEVLERGRRTRFERDAAARWFVHDAGAAPAGAHRHTAEPGAAARIDATLATFARTRIERSLVVEPAWRPRYGLDDPALIVLVHAADGRVAATIEVGSVAPDGISRYVLVPATGAVHLIADYQVAGLLKLPRGADAPRTEP